MSTMKFAAPVLAVFLMMGCSSSGTQSHGQAVDSGMVKAEAVPNKLLEIPMPSVEIDDGFTTVSGSVHRKPGVTSPLSGRIDIEFIDTDGEVIEFLPARLTPQKIPLDPNSPCTYSTEYGWVPPRGSTVRIHFVDSLTAQREDLEAARTHKR